MRTKLNYVVNMISRSGRNVAQEQIVLTEISKVMIRSYRLEFIVFLQLLLSYQNSLNRNAFSTIHKWPFRVQEISRKNSGIHSVVQTFPSRAIRCVKRFDSGSNGYPTESWIYRIFPHWVKNSSLFRHRKISVGIFRVCKIGHLEWFWNTFRNIEYLIKINPNCKKKKLISSKLHSHSPRVLIPRNYNFNIQGLLLGYDSVDH